MSATSNRRYSSFVVFGRLVAFAISSDWDGWDVGLFSVKVVTKKELKAKGLRIVIWRLAMWFELKSD